MLHEVTLSTCTGERRSLPIGPGRPGEGTCPQLRLLLRHANAWRPLWGDYTPVASPPVSVVEDVPGERSWMIQKVDVPPVH